MGQLSNRTKRLGSGADFKMLKVIYKVMDKWRLDPIIGFFIPGLGDFITTVVTIPFIFTSIFKLRSVPLTLAIISNCLLDLLIGMVPVVGDIGDFMYKSYKQYFGKNIPY